MKYGSVCSGIEAASVAWHPLGWEPQWFSEIEAFPSAVLQHRFPSVPNLGDMTKLHENETFKLSTIDVLVGGTPCQSFSVAGLRKGLDDPRGNLMLQFLNLAQRKRPRWVVWENVPGVLSSNEGKDFGTFLSGLAELGYGFAYRVLDAQYFGVAQRRRRVFVVGYLGDWRPAAAVLFERHSLSWHLAPSREKREGIAAFAESSIGGYREDSIGGTLKASGGVLSGGSETFVPHAFKVRGGCEGSGKGYLGQDEAAFTISTNQDQMVFDNVNLEANTFIDTFTYKGLNYASTQKRNPVAILSVLREKIGTKAFAQWGLGILNTLQSSQILQSDLHGIGIRPASFSDSRFIYGSLSCKEDYSAWIMQSLREAGCERCSSQGWKLSEQFTGELRTYLQKLPRERASSKRLLQDLWEADEGEGLLRKALSEIQKIRRPYDDENEPTHADCSIRRLTPIETEILQGFPIGWTRIPYRNKSEEDCPDGPRYKACGNSMAVPVMRWIGERIDFVESILSEQK